MEDMNLRYTFDKPIPLRIQHEVHDCENSMFETFSTILS